MLASYNLYIYLFIYFFGKFAFKYIMSRVCDYFLMKFFSNTNNAQHKYIVKPDAQDDAHNIVCLHFMISHMSSLLLYIQRILCFGF